MWGLACMTFLSLFFFGMYIAIEAPPADNEGNLYLVAFGLLLIVLMWTTFATAAVENPDLGSQLHAEPVPHSIVVLRQHGYEVRSR